MKKIATTLLVYGCYLLIAGTATAQVDSNVYNERVVVTSRYRPVVEESPKLNVAPTITDTVATLSRNLTYDIQTRRLTSLYEPSRIKAARIIGEPATKLYNNYLRLGMGNYWSPLGEVYWSSLRSADRTYGVRATHHSSWGTIGSKKEAETNAPSSAYYGQAPFSFTDITAFGKYITNKHLQLSADLGYQNDFARYYGFSDSTLFSRLALPRDSVARSSYRVAYNTVGLNLGVKTLNTDMGALGYEATVGATDLMASYGQNEFNVRVDGNIHYGFTLNRASKAVAYMHLTYDGYSNNFHPKALPYGADNTLQSALPVAEGPSTLDSSRYRQLFKVNPYADFLFSGFQVHAGAVVAMDGYNYPKIKPFVFPDVTANKNFFGDLLGLTVAATGGIDANSWNHIRTVNPFIAPGSPVRATSHYDLAANLNLNLSKKIDANLYGTYSYLSNDLSFLLDTHYVLQNVFTPVYDSLTRLKVGGNFVFVNDEMLRLEVRGNYYLYHNRQTDTVGGKRVELPLYYRPDFDVTVAAMVNYHDKVFGRVEFQLLGKTPYATETDAAGDDVTLYLPMRYGLDLEVEYRHNKALSFFLKVDNLLFQRYYYWQNYPSYRGLVLAGLTYTLK